MWNYSILKKRHQALNHFHILKYIIRQSYEFITGYNTNLRSHKYILLLVMNNISVNLQKYYL